MDQYADDLGELLVDHVLDLASLAPAFPGPLAIDLNFVARW